MAKLECGCNITDHRPGGEFLLYAGSTYLGRSELEWEDAAEGVWLRSGRFSPASGYWPLQDLFQRQGRALVTARLASVPYNQAVQEELSTEIKCLNLRLCLADGTEIPVSSFDLQDCVDALSEDPRELQVEIRDPSVHAKYFCQPVV